MIGSRCSLECSGASLRIPFSTYGSIGDGGRVGSGNPVHICTKRMALR